MPPLHLFEDIKSVTELKTQTRTLLEQVHRTGRPIVITVNGRPDAVLVDAEQYERDQKALHLAALLAEGEADVRAGRTRPARDVLKEMEDGAARKVPRRGDRRRRA